MTKHKTKIIDIWQESENAIAFKLEKPEGFEYQAGQFVFVELPIEVEHPRQKWIWLSIASAPSEDHLLFLVKEGLSKWKEKIKCINSGKEACGDMEVEICDAKGIFVLPEETDTPIVLLTAGVGIAAIRGMIIESQSKKSEQKMTLFYSNYKPETASFLNELQEIDYPNFELIATMTRMGQSKKSWDGETGRINIDKINKYVEDIKKVKFYIVGAPEFIDHLVEMLTNEGIDKKSIVLEKFTGL